MSVRFDVADFTRPELARRAALWGVRSDPTHCARIGRGRPGLHAPGPWPMCEAARAPMGDASRLLFLAAQLPTFISVSVIPSRAFRVKGI